MLRVDWKVPLLIGGLLTPQLMTPQHHHLAGVQEQVQGATHTQRSDETQEEGIPCTETGNNVCE
jgi:hypothetical protein